MAKWSQRSHARLMCGAASAAIMFYAGAAYAQTSGKVEIAPQPLASALNEFGVQTGHQVIFAPALTGEKITRGVSTDGNIEIALAQLLDGSGLSYRRDGDTFLIVRASDPQSGSAAGDGAEGTVQALIVTAQKREEDIQDVPIAISAFTQEDLTRSQIAGGPDLMTQVPNFTFTKTNFSSYSIQIRGIGTQAISATTDPAVAVAFNNTPFVRNRFFEQEFYDLQRVEVLRGPQGTLYGRNATAGVVNIISAKPSFHYEARLSGDVGNYNSTRLEGMINFPLVDDKVALRVAGAWTTRDGYSTNEITGNPIDGRDLWSTRVSLRIAPNDNINANLIWEHFQEDDDRLRSGKQLCDTHVVTSVGGFPVTFFQYIPNASNNGLLLGGSQARFSQGCKAASLYAPESFQTPNGPSLPYYVPLSAIWLPTGRDDPYVNRTQSRDLRAIESTVDPHYLAKSDLGELQVSIGLSNNLTLSSETSYSADFIFSTEDFNRFNTAPGAWDQALYDSSFGSLQYRAGVLNNGAFCDPQVGCSDRLVAVDLSTAKSNQFSQEFRLSSDYDGRFNFNLGVNFLRYDTVDKYYVFINSVSLIAARSPFGRGDPLPPYVAGVSDNHECLPRGMSPGDPRKVYQVLLCTYIDPNPINSLNDLGHNYFLSKNPYKLISYAAFGEAYYNVTEALKVTAGLRWTVDKKEAPRIPSWLLGSNTVGYPVAEVIRQEWREPTGRLALDWKPDLAFTDETLVYTSYARGYKAGGANPPGYVYVHYASADVAQAASDRSATRPKRFQPEYVDAFEIGSKNTLLDGRMTLNLSGFYYDYTGYQISEIVDRSAFNRNFDATVWGLEVEADWRPLENLRLGFKGGYEKTRLADGSKAIDLMDRTAGDPSWTVVKPFPTFASNCILPTALFAGTPNINFGDPTPGPVDLGGLTGGWPSGCEIAYVEGLDPVTDAPYVDLTTVTGPIVEGQISSLSWHPGYTGWNPATAPNNGEGIFKDVSGHELPNAPHFTATVTGDYTLPLPNDWLMMLHGDFYYQSEAWTRIFNTPGYDKLKAYTNVNLAAIFTNEDAGWKVMAYIKNVFDRDSITGAFLNSDDTGLTTNVFLTEPRLYGLRVTKEWDGGPWWTGAGANHAGPYPLTVEVGGQVQRHDAPYETMTPNWIDAIPDPLNPLAAQNRDLDWGDGRYLKLTYRPAGSSWNVSSVVRRGRTNNGNTWLHLEEPAGPKRCILPAPFNDECDPMSSAYNSEASIAGVNWSNAFARSGERYDVVDFTVGKDVGFGLGGGASALNLGLRYAHFQSQTAMSMDVSPDLSLADGWIFKYSSAHRYQVSADAERSFEGAGPTLAWDGAAKLLGNEVGGHLDIDWSATAGVLFGKQHASVLGSQQSGYVTGKYYFSDWRQFSSPDVTPIAVRRSKSSSVPLLDLSLGLSYEVQRFKIGAGYRWERYFNAIDGGYAERKSYDRTIDGPYFKVSVGFGG